LDDRFPHSITFIVLNAVFLDLRMPIKSEWSLNKMKRNILIVFGLLGLSSFCFVAFSNSKTSAQSSNRPRANSSNSNPKMRSNVNGYISNQVSNVSAGNTFVSNTGQLIVQPKASGSEVTTINDAGVTVIFPKGYEIYDVAKLYPGEADNPDRLFNTRASLHSVNTDWGIELTIYTSNDLSFEGSINNSRDLIVGNRGYKVLKRGVKSTINGFDVVSSSEVKEAQIWTIDAFKTPNASLIVVAIGFPEDMKKNKGEINALLQSIKRK
jgi:hypothetical protein